MKLFKLSLYKETPKSSRGLDVVRKNESKLYIKLLLFYNSRSIIKEDKNTLDLNQYKRLFLSYLEKKLIFLVDI